VFDTNFIMSADRVMGSIIHQVWNLDAEEHVDSDGATFGHPINAFFADRKRQGGRGRGNWVENKRHDMTNFSMKCGACGDPNHVSST
jgi:hypothetical protein